MKRAPGTFLSALGSNPPRFSRQIKETSAWMSLLFGGGRWIRTTEGIASRFTVCPIWPLWNSPIFSCVGAGGRIRTPDLLITNVGWSVKALISGAFLSFHVRGSTVYKPSASIQYIRSCSRLGHGLGQVLLAHGSRIVIGGKSCGAEAQNLRRYKQRKSRIYNHIIFFCIVRRHSLTRSRISPLSRAA